VLQIPGLRRAIHEHRWEQLTVFYQYVYRIFRLESEVYDAVIQHLKGLGYIE